MRMNAQEELLEQSREERRKAKDKIHNYAKYVKEMYWPKVSTRKQVELQAIREHIDKRNIRRSVNDLSSAQTGNPYHRNNLRLATSDNEQDLNEIREVVNGANTAQNSARTKSKKYKNMNNFSKPPMSS